MHRERLRRKMGADSLAELSRIAGLLQIYPTRAPSIRPNYQTSEMVSRYCALHGARACCSCATGNVKVSVLPPPRFGVNQILLPHDTAYYLFAPGKGVVAMINQEDGTATTSAKLFAAIDPFGICWFGEGHWAYYSAGRGGLLPRGARARRNLR